MFVNFNKVFNPTREDKIKRLENYIKIRKDLVGDCCTCVFYKSPPLDTPGFIIDLGECIQNMEYFSSKVCKSKKITCTTYIENKSNLEAAIKELKELKRRTC